MKIKYSLSIILILSVVFQVIPEIVTAQVSLKQAQDLEQQEEYELALSQYQDLFEEESMNSGIVMGLLRTSTRLNRTKVAKRALDRIEELNPSKAENARWGVKLFFKNNEYETALEWVSRYKNRNSDSWRPYHFEAQIYQSLQNYSQAMDAIEAATIRSENNQWVTMDRLLVQYFLDGEIDSDLLNHLKSIADNPAVYWRITRTAGLDWSRKRVISFLEEGAGLFPADLPPLLPALEESEYRYWWSRFHYELGNEERAKDVFHEPNGRDALWLKSLLSKDRVRMDEHWKVLDNFPDHLPYQWQYSRKLREQRSLNQSRRQNISDFFFREFKDNHFRNYLESAYGALMRSLEMNPVHADRQFRLAKFLHDRGWKKLEREVIDRVRELDTIDPDRVQDYSEGLGSADTPIINSRPTVKIDIIVQKNDIWQGPVEGTSTILSLLRQNFYHQPAFQVNSSRINQGRESVALELKERIRDGVTDGGIVVTIEEWNSSLKANVDYFYPDETRERVRFLDSGRMKLWRLTDQAVTKIKDGWPWSGNVKELSNRGGWVNLGRIHGFESGDTLTIQTDQLDVEERVLELEQVRQNQSIMTFPTPYYRTIIPRETKVTKNW